MKSWTDKLQSTTPHEIKRMPVTRAGVAKGGAMLLPSVRMIDEFIRDIPRRQQMSVVEMRAELAKRHKADGACPVYTGYHLRTCAEAAFEAYAQGMPLTKVTPVWRVLDEKALTLKKLSAANRELILAQRKREGL
ncbi:MAG: hypothetical protein IPK59_15590 [Rhodospirillaceae bacterium]|nr:hypothetical protein [Rhodospirillaceae bacterium]